MTAQVAQTVRQTNKINISPSIFQRFADSDKTAAKDCIDTYGNFVWALAKKFTASAEEAEAATQEIFMDIWRYSQRADKVETAENLIIALIAQRRLIKYLQQAK